MAGEEVGGADAGMVVAQPGVPQPWERHEGDLPVVLHVPHAGAWIPDERDAFVLDDGALELELRRMTDHQTDVLARGAVDAGAYALVNRLSRLVCDPERFPDARGRSRCGAGSTDG